MANGPIQKKRIDNAVVRPRGGNAQILACLAGTSPDTFNDVRPLSVSLRTFSRERSSRFGLLGHCTGLLLWLCLARPSQAWATAYVSNQSGNWDTPAVWTPNGTPTTNDTATILSPHTVTVATSGATAKSLTINSGGTLYLGSGTTPRSIALSGSLANHGKISGITGGGANGMVFSANGSWTGKGDLSAGKVGFTVNPGVTLDASGLSSAIKFRATGTINNTVNGTLIAGTQVIDGNGDPLCSFILGANGTFITANPNGIIKAAVGALNIAGTVTLPATANYVFNGTAAQVTDGLPETVNTLAIANAAGVTLSESVLVNGAFTLAAGKLVTGLNTLSLGAGASVSGAGSTRYVAGTVNRSFTNGSAQAFTFPIGDDSFYTPLALSNLTVTTTGSLAVFTTAAENLHIWTSTINPFQSANRYWTASAAGGLTISTCAVTANFVAGDVDAGASPENFVMEAFDGSSWWPLASGARTSTNATATGVNVFGEFALGEFGASPATQIRVETAADGSGTVVPAQTLTAGHSLTAYAIARQADNTFVANIPAAWSLPAPTGGVDSGDLVPAADSKSAAFTGHLAGTATLRAAAGALASTDSATVTVQASGVATQVRVETAADGSGMVVPAQSIYAGGSLPVFAVARDAGGNFVASVAADSWTVVNHTGLQNSNLSPNSGPGSTFTASSSGTGQISANISGLAPVVSGVITVPRAYNASVTNYDVYLVGGQSNADGRGATGELTNGLAAWQLPQPDVRIYYANPLNLNPTNPTYNSGWQTMAPGFSAAPGFSGALPSRTFGPELAFARTVADANPNRRVAIIKVTQGGTSLTHDWNPTTGYLYVTFTNMSRVALQALTEEGARYTLRGMIWHQGESDGSLSTAAYQAELTAFIAAVRRDLGVTNLPFVVGELATNRSATVRQAQRNVAQVVPYAGFASSSNLPTLLSTDPHFTAASQLIMGQRMAAALETPVPALTGMAHTGTHLTFTASGLGQSYCWLRTTTNLAQPFTDWTVAATNFFDAQGRASFNQPIVFTMPGKFFWLDPQ